MRCFIFLLLFIFSSAYGLDKSSATRFVDSVSLDILSLVEDSSLSDDAYLSRVDKIFEDRLDIGVISQFLLGPYVRGLDSVIYADFKEVVKEYITLVYGLRLREYYNGERLEVSNVAEQGGTYLVHSYIVSEDGDGSLGLSWRLYRDKSGVIRVIDLIFGEISMVISQRDEFTSIIRNNDGDVRILIADMRKQAQRVSSEFFNRD